MSDAAVCCWCNRYHTFPSPKDRSDCPNVPWRAPQPQPVADPCCWCGQPHPGASPHERSSCPNAPPADDPDYIDPAAWPRIMRWLKAGVPAEPSIEELIERVLAGHNGFQVVHNGAGYWVNIRDHRNRLSVGHNGSTLRAALLAALEE